MKPTILLLLLTFYANCFAQKTALDKDSFNFWVGTWKAEWEEQDGNVGIGTNKVVKVLDGAAIEENFEILRGKQAGYKGKSLSVYNPATGVWHQAWVDNQNSYLNFIGGLDSERKVFQTLPVEKDGVVSQQRMAFYAIEHDSFTWDWEGSRDGGETWNLLWRINYTRIE